jgi:hypothetical protein
MIADWGDSLPASGGYDAYLIERVRPHPARGRVTVDFLRLDHDGDCRPCPNDNRSMVKTEHDGKVRIREATDLELALIAKFRLIGGSDA